jgi:hypothetical protein
MDACKDDKRVFLPNLEDFFGEAIEQNAPEAIVETYFKLSSFDSAAAF